MTPEQLKAVADIASVSIKVANAAKAALAAAPKPVDPAVIEKAAKTLVETGFVAEGLLAAAQTKLASPAGALEVLGSVAQKAAEELARRDGREPNAKLATGEVLPVDPTKQAAAVAAENHEAFVQRMNRFNRKA